MFWSEQILVNRKSGVATVWLVATLGSRSGLRKVTRKEILDVDVAKACKTIREPGAPMALRLSGSLMYGVVRVYSQQCEYVLVDVQGARDRMKSMLRVVRATELDENAGKARPDQINLPYDPTFVLDASIFDLDLLTPGLTPDGSQRSSRLTPLSGPPSPHSQQSQGQKSILGLDIGTSDSGEVGDIGGFEFPDAGGSSAQKSNPLGGEQDDHEGSFILEPLFDFDQDGNIRELSPTRDPAPPPPPPGANIPSQDDSAIDRRVRNEHEEGLLAGIDNGLAQMDIDDFQPNIGDDLDMLPDIEMGEDAPPTQPAQPPQSSHFSSDPVESSETAEAPMRPRKKKTLELDRTQEMRNEELKAMNTEYAANMQHQAAQRSVQRMATQAKKNALFWVWSLGIGGVGQGIGLERIPNPLHAFGGDELYEALTGENSVVRKRKTSPVDDASTDSETRRKRAREEDADQMGRGDDLMQDDGIMQLDDDGIEVGRDAPSALADISSLMPWNSGSIQGSRHGSSARGKPFIGSVGGFPSSAGGPSSVPGMDLTRRGRRLTSQSPLTGRGPGPILERFSSAEPGDDGNDLGDIGVGDDVLGGEQEYDEEELHGPGAKVDTQTAAQSQWMRAALDQESSNFFAFLRVEAGHRAGGEIGIASVTFEELLPSEEHSRIVAAQAFLHLLSLATKALITVRQEDDFGDIQVDIAVED